MLIKNNFVTSVYHEIHKGRLTKPTIFIKDNI